MNSSTGVLPVFACVFIPGLEDDLGCLDVRIVSTVGVCVGLLFVAVVVIAVLACRRSQHRHRGSVAPVAAGRSPLHRLRAAGRMVIAANKWLQFGQRIAKAATRRPRNKSNSSSKGQVCDMSATSRFVACARAYVRTWTSAMIKLTFWGFPGVGAQRWLSCECQNTRRAASPRAQTSTWCWKRWRRDQSSRGVAVEGQRYVVRRPASYGTESPLKTTNACCFVSSVLRLVSIGFG